MMMVLYDISKCVFMRVFKKFLKVVRAGKNGVKWGKMGVKSLGQNPHIYTTTHNRTYPRFVGHMYCDQVRC